MLKGNESLLFSRVTLFLFYYLSNNGDLVYFFTLKVTFFLFFRYLRDDWFNKTSRILTAFKAYGLVIQSEKNDNSKFIIFSQIICWYDEYLQNMYFHISFKIYIHWLKIRFEKHYILPSNHNYYSFWYNKFFNL